MNEKQYVNGIIRKIKCGPGKRKDIKIQLLGEIQERKSHGETFARIMEQMGTPEEIAEGFNENLSEQERRGYGRNKAIKIILAVMLLVMAAGCVIYWKLPRGPAIEESAYFGKEEVEASMKDVVELLDAGDYETLRQQADEKMQPYFTEEAMGDARKAVSDDWGERMQFGKVYLTELTQGGRHYAVGEIMVTYEKVSATYRITFDEDMRVAGVYIR